MDTWLYVAGGCVAGSALAWAAANKSRYRREALSRVQVLTPSQVDQWARSRSGKGGGTIDYVAINGTVACRDRQRLHSLHADPPVPCVIHEVEVKEHRQVWQKKKNPRTGGGRGGGSNGDRRNGSWTLKVSTQSKSQRMTPFQIVEASSVTSSNGNGGGGGVVEVPAAGATMKSNGFATLELVKVHDLYKPSSGFSLKSMGGYLGGDYVQGHQTLERVVPIGIPITAVGKVVVNPNGGNAIIVRPNDSSLTFAFTFSSLKDLIHEEDAYEYWMRTGCKVLLAAAVTLGAYHYWTKRERDREQREERAFLAQHPGAIARAQSLGGHAEEARAATQGRLDVGDDVNSSSVCVICIDAPRDTVFLPCGHVACCHACAEMIRTRCPVCRSTIQSRSRVYFA